MPAGSLHFQAQVAAQEALAHGASLPDRLSPANEVALYAAALTGDAYCIGRYQHEQQALGTTPAKPWLRRSSGGGTLRAGSGISYVALALHERSSLMKCPPGRLLNRNVRGVLTGLRQAGLQINYFGRDFLSHGAEPLIYVAWDLREDGRALLEFFVAHHAPWFVPASEQAYPARNEPALRGRTPTTLADVAPTLDFEQLARAIADGHARSFGVSWTQAEAAAPSPAALAATHAPRSDETLAWSSPREEAIGFVSAGVALDPAGNFARVRVAGDFFAHRVCTATLETQLSGVRPSEHAVGEAVDAVFARAGYDVEGIRSLSVIRDAIMEAEAAQRSTP